MDSSKSPKEFKTLEAHQNRISGLPSIVIDKILKRLPLPMVAKMSLLSTKWRDTWVSHRYIVFDKMFWDGHGGDKGTLRNKVSNIINSILLHHSGPLHKFHLYIPYGSDYGEDRLAMYLTQWLSFLFKAHVRKIELINWHYRVPLPYHLFACQDLVKLRLQHFRAYPPPSVFKGFAYLQSLVLVDIEIKCDILASVIACCPRLKVLLLDRCTGITSLAIDAPNLEDLEIKGVFATLHFKRVARLKRISLSLLSTDTQDLGNRIFNSLKLLATSCECLQYLRFGGIMCKVLATSGVTNSLSLAFKHLKELCLMTVGLSDLNVFGFTLGMIQGCPCIENLEISVTAFPNTFAENNIGFDDSFKLNHLITMKITGIRGSSEEIKFLEYMLSVAVVLELLYFKCTTLDLASELKVSRDLLCLRRASAKAFLFGWVSRGSRNGFLCVRYQRM